MPHWPLRSTDSASPYLWPPPPSSVYGNKYSRGRSEGRRKGGYCGGGRGTVQYLLGHFFLFFSVDKACNLRLANTARLHIICRFSGYFSLTCPAFVGFSWHNFFMNNFQTLSDSSGKKDLKKEIRIEHLVKCAIFAFHLWPLIVRFAFHWTFNWDWWYCEVW